MKVIKCSALLLLLPLRAFCTEQTPQLSQPTITLPKQNLALRKHLPNLYNTLLQNKSTGLDLVEFLERIALDHKATTSWHLAQTPQHFIGELLQMLDTIVAKQGKQPLYTCTLNGNAGTLPILLLSAGLYRLGIHDLAFQLIGNEPSKGLRQLNHSIRSIMSSRDDRFHLQQVDSIDTLIKTSARHLRKSSTIITFEGSNSKLLANHCSNDKPLIFNYATHTIS
jgi:hypothetical protein